VCSNSSRARLTSLTLCLSSRKPKKKHHLLKIIGWLMLISQISQMISSPGKNGALIIPILFTIFALKKGNWLLIFIAAIIAGAFYSV